MHFNRSSRDSHFDPGNGKLYVIGPGQNYQTTLPFGIGAAALHLLTILQKLHLSAGQRRTRTTLGQMHEHSAERGVVHRGRRRCPYLSHLGIGVDKGQITIAVRIGGFAPSRRPGHPVAHLLAVGVTHRGIEADGGTGLDRITLLGKRRPERNRPLVDGVLADPQKGGPHPGNARVAGRQGGVIVHQAHVMKTGRAGDHHILLRIFGALQLPAGRVAAAVVGVDVNLGQILIGE